MTTARESFALVALPAPGGDELYAIGGYANGTPLSSVERYDQLADKWEVVVADMSDVDGRKIAGPLAAAYLPFESSSFSDEF